MNVPSPSCRRRVFDMTPEARLAPARGGARGGAIPRPSFSGNPLSAFSNGHPGACPRDPGLSPRLRQGRCFDGSAGSLRYAGSRRLKSRRDWIDKVAPVEGISRAGRRYEPRGVRRVPDLAKCFGGVTHVERASTRRSIGGVRRARRQGSGTVVRFKATRRFKASALSFWEGSIASARCKSAIASSRRPSAS